MAQRMDHLHIPFERPEWYLPYIAADGKMRRYYPDFWIPHIGKYVEVKCPYLFKTDSKVAILRAERTDIIWVISLKEIENFQLPPSPMTDGHYISFRVGEERAQDCSDAESMDIDA